MTQAPPGRPQDAIPSEPIPALRGAALFLLAAAALALVDPSAPPPSKAVGWSMTYAHPAQDYPIQDYP